MYYESEEKEILWFQVISESERGTVSFEWLAVARHKHPLMHVKTEGNICFSLKNVNW